MTTNLAKTPLYDWHVDHGGRIVDFGGWAMPVQYTSIVQEHSATRNAVGLFDISHMGRLRFDGTDAAAFLDSLVTRRIVGMQQGRIRYGLLTNERGGTIDDVLVYRLHDDGGPFHLMVVNASNREKAIDWLCGHIEAAGDVQLRDLTHEMGMVAVQGPRALEIVAPLVGCDPNEMKYYTGCCVPVAGTSWIVSRTGYTGEDGCELIVPADAVVGLWEQLASSAAAVGGVAVGLGARDTLRLEAAMPLYGHELSEKITPIQAGLGFAVNLKDRVFPGHDELAKLRDDPTLPRRVGLECAGKRVPREGFAIHYQGEPVGEVTSGTFSPTLERPIAMGYVAPAVAEPGTELAIDVRGRYEPARIVPLPFYQRPEKSC